MRATPVVLVLAMLTTSLTAQAAPPRAKRDSIIELPAMTVTATRDLREVFRTPAPVSVVDSTGLARRQPGNVTDLFLDLPGLDVNGVGPSQSRPVIRGQLGQRILLLEDGIRMNNSRRQQDFGEIPSIVALEALGRVEVVRGPASVLYGTDAIGGAVNLITRQPPRSLVGTSVHGSAGYRFSGVGDQQRPYGVVAGSAGRFNFLAFGSYRDAGAYVAPPGTFGDLTLRSGVRVHGTRAEDQNYAFQVGYGLAENQNLSVRYERYSADTTGFGYVDNAALGTPDAPVIDITYPDQDVDKVSMNYTARGISLPVADRVDVTGYYQSNQRHLNLDIFIPFVGPGLPPGAGLVSTTRNFTDLNTVGFRVEAAKAVGTRHLLTYGVDGFRDGSTNTDTLTNIVVGFGPPTPEVSTTPQIPNASFRSLGAFAQMEFGLLPRLTVIAGVRGQNIRAATRTTPGITTPNVTSTSSTLVGSLNTSYALTEQLSLIGTVGRGFRSPNLVERFFTGPTPEGSGYQRQTPGLRPETSINVDLGFRLRGRRLQLEVFGFRNEITDGIAIAPTGDTVQGLPEYQNVNVNKLRYLGLEVAGQARLVAGFSAAANLTVFDAKDVKDPSNPVGQTYGSRVGGSLRYDHPDGRFWASYDARHYGQQKDVSISSPVGAPTPRYVVQDLRAGARLFRAGITSHSVSLTLSNLANRLYSETSNTSFFRPAPGRTLTAGYRVDF